MTQRLIRQSVGVTHWDSLQGKPDIFPSNWQAVSDKPDVFPHNEESGVWTPSLAGSIARGNHTYAPSERSGWFVRINKRVFVDFAVAATTKDTAINGNIFIDGLPFPIKSLSPYLSGCALGGFSGFIFPSGYSQLLAQGTRGTNQLLIRFYGSNLMPSTCTQAQLGSAVTVRGSMSYLID